MTLPKRRVLWLIKSLDVGGAERLLVSLASVVPDDGRYRYEVAYMLSEMDALRPDLEAVGVEVHDLGARHNLDPAWLPRLRTLVTARRHDVVHVHSPLVAGAARPVLRTIARRDRPAVVATEHSVWSNYLLPTRLLNAVTFPLDDAHIAVSDAVRESIPPRLAGDLSVIVQGIVVDDVRKQRQQRTRIRSELGLAPDDVVVTTVANLRPEKDYPTLLEAAAHVVRDHPQVRFVAVGYGPDEERIRALHRTTGLGGSFRFVGFRDDAVAVTAASDVFALASYQEGFPIAVLEAMAAGVPVVATAVGGIPSAVVDGVNGYVVPPRRPDLLSDRIARLVRDHALRSRMSCEASSMADRFDIRTTLARTEALYTRLLTRDDMADST